ncbi:MAG: M16 family metallopeptidase [Bacteroidales bacterium]
MTDKIRKIKKPPVLTVYPEHIQDTEKFTLSNKIPVYVINGGNEEVMKIDFIFRAGLTMEEIPLQASTTVQMLTEGTEKFSAEEINRELDYYGIALNTTSDRDWSSVTLLFLNKHITKVLELCSEIIFKPRFSEKELKTLMNRRLQWFLVNRERVSSVATECFFESIFGKTHPYGLRLSPDDFQRIKPSHLRNFHSKYYTPRELTIIISGKIHPFLKDLIDQYIGKIDTTVSGLPKTPPLPYGEKEKRIFITKKGAVQSAIRIGSQTIKRTNPDFPSLFIANTILGGYFGSRLMKNLREQRGYTYGIYSFLASLELAGYLMISTEAAKKYTVKAVNEIFKEIKLLQEKPVGKEELEMVKNYLAGDLLRMFDGPFATAESFRMVWESGLDLSYYLKVADKIKTITPDEIIHIARTYYNVEDMYVVIAGDNK